MDHDNDRMNGDAAISEKVILGQTADGGPGAGAAASLDIAKSFELAREVAGVIDDKKGRDIVVMDISRQSSFADFFVNATASNTRMLATIKDEIAGVLAKGGNAVRGSEGKPDTGWVLVDCGDVVVNLFLEEQRNKYQIEKIWRDAGIVEWQAQTQTQD